MEDLKCQETSSLLENEMPLSRSIALIRFLLGNCKILQLIKPSGCAIRIFLSFIITLFLVKLCFSLKISASNIFTVTMATKGDATDYDDLNASPSQLPQIGTVANSNKAIVAGGTTGGETNVIQSFSMATTGQSADFGDLTVPRYAPAGVSDSHGGLLE